MTKRTIAILSIIMLASSGCAIRNWAPPAGEHDQITVASAKCDLFAQGGGDSSTFAAAYGTPKFVGLSMGAMALGSAIGTAAKQARLYNDCMLANGWTPAATQ